MMFMLKRLGMLVATLLVVSFLAFLIPYLTPGDPARKILRARVGGELDLDPAALAASRHQYGLDRPLLAQYRDWLGNAARGDFGLSYTSRTPVVEMIGGALAVTAMLVLTALVIAILVAVPLGSLAARPPAGVAGPTSGPGRRACWSAARRHRSSWCSCC